MERQDRLIQILGDLYSDIADGLNISATQYASAERAYNTVGEYLRAKVSKEIDVFAQGSMNLGTVVKPSDDTEDFDVDLVARINDGFDWSNYKIKNEIGSALKEHDVYKRKIAEEGEGKRCWTIQYDNFHMDILPCVPLSADRSEDTEIRLTHRVAPLEYESRYSNPEGYLEWFMLQSNKNESGLVPVMESREFAELKKLPMYKYRKPLQKAIQIIKRHRNIYFANNGNGEDRPISIILTTLGSKAYRGESNVYRAVARIITDMAANISLDLEGVYTIENPALKTEKENFAEKWNECPRKAAAFYSWLEQAKIDLVRKPLEIKGKALGDFLGSILGDKPSKEAYRLMLERQTAARDMGNLSVNSSLGLFTLDPIGYAVPTKAITVPKHTFYGDKK